MTGGRQRREEVRTGEDRTGWMGQGDERSSGAWNCTNKLKSPNERCSHDDNRQVALTTLSCTGTPKERQPEGRQNAGSRASLGSSVLPHVNIAARAVRAGPRRRANWPATRRCELRWAGLQQLSYRVPAPLLL